MAENEKQTDQAEVEDLDKFESRGSEVVPHETPATPAQTIALAISQGADLDKLERLLDLQIKHEQNEAKKAYHLAMSRFKLNPPEIDKDRKVQYSTDKGTVKYDHASLANVTEKIIKALGGQELSHGWKTEQGEGGLVTVECVITHSQGHSESNKLSAQPDLSGSKNAIQALGSTITYLERYTLLALTGLATHDQDDDGRASEQDFINEKQLSTITDMINNLNADEEKFCEVMGADSLAKIPSRDFNKAMKALKDKERALKEKS